MITTFTTSAPQKESAINSNKNNVAAIDYFDPMHEFFKNLEQRTRRFNPINQLEARRQLSNIVYDIEITELAELEKTNNANTPNTKKKLKN